MNIRKMKGFTLIELMITVAIVGILASVALPAYQDYILRAQAIEAISISSGIKRSVDVMYAETGNLERIFENGGVNLGYTSGNLPSGKYAIVRSVQDDGILIEMSGPDVNSKLKGEWLRLRAIEYETPDGSLKWLCGAWSQGMAKYLPPACNNHIYRTNY